MDRNVPGVLWVTLVALAITSLIHFMMALAQTRLTPLLTLLVGAALEALFVVWLYRGHRWAFVAMLVFAALGVLAALIRHPATGMVTVVLDAIVIVPMLMARRHFFPARAPGLPPGARFCPRCGRDTSAPPTTNCPVCSVT